MPLTKPDESALIGAVQDFLIWLIGKLDAKPSQKYDSFRFVDPDESDWFMDVPTDNTSPVRFNTSALKSCGLEYYKLIVIHECFHLFTQDVPNKLDAKRVKDDFGDTMMVLLDIEADFYASVFYKEVLNYSLVQYLSLNFHGAKTFSDKNIRTPKFERFIGTKLSVANHFIREGNRDCVLFLVSTESIATERAIHMIVAKPTHFQLAQIKVDQSDMDKLLSCYQLNNDFQSFDYIDGIIRFCAKALTLDVPAAIEEELREIKLQSSS